MKNTLQTTTMTARTALVFGLSILSMLTVPVQSQNLFSSGSTGADGALTFTAPPTARRSAPLVFNAARQTAFTFGGLDQSGHLNSTMDYDGTTWNNVAPVFAPLRRDAHSMTYDTVRDKVILYGGFSPDSALATTETWEYSDDRWIRIPTTNNPGSAVLRTLVYDSSRQVAVLFGGIGTSISSDTWEYTGTDWNFISNSTVPARFRSTMAYDSNRNLTVLFGGTENTTLLNDVWEYNGTWTNRTFATRPTARRSSAMSFDSSRNTMVLFGGFDGIYQNDTWEYDGTGWTKITPANLPPGRGEPGLCYDSSRNRTVLFGGFNATGNLNDTWEWDGTNWTEQIELTDSPIIDMNDHADGIWNYTTVNIGEGVTLSFSSNTNNTPVTWLTTGNVVIDGDVDISGEHGSSVTAAATRAMGGPGGFAGGLGGLFFSENQKSGEPGLGPGGGLPGITEGENGSHAGFAVVGAGPGGGSAYGNIFNAPIIGGSGGGGGAAAVTNITHGGLGGGGGGAILIASSETITLNGTINADGGTGEIVANAGNGGDGSGGAARLVADRVDGAGTISAGENGRIRIEGFVVALDEVFTPIQSQAPPYEVDLAGQGAIRIVQVDGALVRANPLGDINNPDVVFTNTGPVSVSLETENIPLATTIELRITSGSQVITTTSTGIAGTVGAGTASATATVPAGSGTIQAFAEFTE